MVITLVLFLMPSDFMESLSTKAKRAVSSLILLGILSFALSLSLSSCLVFIQAFLIFGLLNRRGFSLSLVIYGSNSATSVMLNCISFVSCISILISYSTDLCKADGYRSPCHLPDVLPQLPVSVTREEDHFSTWECLKQYIIYLLLCNKFSINVEA